MICSLRLDMRETPKERGSRLALALGQRAEVLLDDAVVRAQREGPLQGDARSLVLAATHMLAAAVL